jgi:hypothetical protein
LISNNLGKRPVIGCWMLDAGYWILDSEIGKLGILIFAGYLPN